MKKIFFGALIIVLALLAVNLLDNREALGSTPIGGEYQATTTGAGSSITAAVNVVKETSGTLGSVVFTTPTVGIVEIYNATTSNVNLRTGNTASSSILIAHFPAGTGTSTVTFDTAFSKGLLMVFKGTVSSSTVTYR